MRGIVFDVDNTLTPPRRPLEREMAEALRALSVPFHVAAGSNLSMVEEQFLKPLYAFGGRGTLDAFVCNGSDRYRCEFGTSYSIRALRTFDLRRYLGDSDYRLLIDVLQRTLALPEFQLPDPSMILGEQVLDRGSMINVAPIGRPAVMTPAAYRNRDAFVQFDEETRYRRRLLAYLLHELAPLRTRQKLRITLGGQTSFDVVVEGNDKRYPLRTLLDEGYTDLLYIGDALYDGGNDAAVLDFIRDLPSDGERRVQAIQVNGWRDTIERLKQLGV
jgi:phosphomannomutase